MRAELQAELQQLASDLPRDCLPQFLGEIEVIRTMAFARIAAPAIERTNDELLDVNEASQRMCVSKDWLYRNSAKLPFTRRIGEGQRLLRFSLSGLNEYLRKQR
ncbi:MAG TPA: hypothetical protein VOA88_10270 [Candidatus Dormibacteraeota bacterium]|nr:hypothetical protein [Candidatus Dormibacteraeota bacterium]